MISSEKNEREEKKNVDNDDVTYNKNFIHCPLSLREARLCEQSIKARLWCEMRTMIRYA